MTKLGDLSNDELLARLRAHVGRGNAWLVGLLGYLAEVDARRLYAEQACTSTWDYCVRRLGMSEGEAQRRIAVARLVRSFPLAGRYLERGAIHLCALYEMHKHLTEDNHEELLREAAGKTTKAVAEMVAARFPKADVHACIQPLVPQPALPVGAAEMLPPHAVQLPAPASPQVRPRVEPLSASRYRVELTVSAETKTKLERVRDLMCHRNPTGDLEAIFELSLDLLLTKLEKERLGKTTRSKVKTRSATTDEDGEGATSAERGGAMSVERTGATTAQRAGASRADQKGNPSGPDPREGSDRPSEHAELEPSVAAQPKTQKPAPTATSAMNKPGAEKSPPSKKPARRGHVSRAVRREVWARDGEQCTYVDAAGNRCPARGFLELDHVEAKALGGSDDATNIRLRCRVHNHLHAEQVFGREYIEERIHLRQRKYVPAAQAERQYAAAAAQAPSFETAARGLRSLGFREPDVRQVIARLATSLEAEASIETIVRDALRLLT